MGKETEEGSVKKPGGNAFVLLIRFKLILQTPLVFLVWGQSNIYKGNMLDEFGSQIGKNGFDGGETNLLFKIYYSFKDFEFLRRCIKFYTETTLFGNCNTD